MKTYILFVVLVIIVFGCTTKKDVSASGYVSVTGGRVWYKIVGKDKGTPIILLHGGPGYPSYYLNPLSALGDDRLVIFYDQLGCGRSDQSIDTSQMHVDNFVEQLDELQKALGLKTFYLYGSSWGTMLATDYYLKHPEKVKALVLSSPCLSATRWVQDADSLVAALPDSIGEAIRTKPTTSLAYGRAVAMYYDSFVSRVRTPDTDSSDAGLNAKLYLYMWGPDEFKATGNLKDYDRTARLGQIKIPTLFMTGEYDEARPSTVRYYQSLVPGSKFQLLKKSSHLSMQDNPEQDVKFIRQFLDNLENN